MKKYKNTVIAIDPSSKLLAFAVTCPQGEFFFVENLPADKTLACGAAYRCMVRTIEEFSYFGNSPHVFCERQLGSPRGGYNALIPQAHVCGAVMAATCSAAHTAPYTPVQVGAWKKAVVGVGSASKDLIAQRIQVMWPKAYTYAMALPKTKGRQDILDAAAINLYGRLYVTGKLPN